MRAVGYIRVSTEEQAANGYGLDAQAVALDAGARRLGLELVGVHVDAGVSATARRRPGLESALTELELPGRDRGVLLVAKVDRLARSWKAAGSLLERGDRQGWALVALDAPETLSAQGEAMMGMLAVFAGLERRMISQRTKDGLARARASGKRLGRPPGVLEPGLVRRIVRLWRAGRSSPKIAGLLNSEGIASPGGATWRPWTVQRVIRRATGATELPRSRVRRRL